MNYEKLKNSKVILMLINTVHSTLNEKHVLVFMNEVSEFWA